MIHVDSLEAVVGYTTLLVCTNTAPVPVPTKIDSGMADSNVTSRVKLAGRIHGLTEFQARNTREGAMER